MQAQDRATRTAAEVVARFHAIKEDDVFGFRQEVLADALSFTEARDGGLPLRPEATEESWGEARLTGDKLIPAARAYLEFAIGKIQDHRGISASRSVDKLGEMAWLAGRDDVVSAMESAPYEQYGAPKVKAFAEGMGFTDIWAAASDAALERMAVGQPCTEDCDSGCGR